MPLDENAVEAQIQAKGLTFPRITPEHVSQTIVAEYTGRASEMFSQAPIHQSLECLTICVLVLNNGFTVVGKSACASPENFDAELGAKIARDDARNQIWALEGYRLRSALAEGSNDGA